MNSALCVGCLICKQDHHFEAPFFQALFSTDPIFKYPGIPIPLKWVSYAFPTMWGADAMRSVV